MNANQICEKLDVIITLLSNMQTTTSDTTTKTDKTPKTPKTKKNTLNRSKFVNDEQRNKILNYIRLPNIISELHKLPKHKQQSALQSMIKDELDIDVSYYMSAKLVSMINQSINQPEESNELKPTELEPTDLELLSE